LITIDNRSSDVPGSAPYLSAVGSTFSFVNKSILLKCALFNARSLINKLDCLKLLLELMCIDILLITETWLDSTIPDSLLSCQNNFVCFRKDRDRFGGGVCILVNSALNIVPVPIPAKFCSLEIVAIND